MPRAEASPARRHVLIVLCVVLAHLLLSGYALAAEPIWIDEGATWLYAQRSLSQLWTVDLWSETNPPTYYSLMRLWVGLFGDSLVAMRSLSLVASCLSLVPIYFVAFRLTCCRWTACLAALAVATSPVVVYYSQEARAFALTMLAAMVAVWGLTVLVTHPAAASRPLLRKPAGRSVPAAVRFAWCAYGLGAAAALYFHFTLVFLLMGCTAVAVLARLFSGRFSGRWALNWFVVNSLVLLLALPVIAAFIYHSLYTLDTFWIAKPTAFDGLVIAADAYVSHLPQGAGGFVVYLIAALAMIAAIGFKAIRRQPGLRIGWVLGVCLAVGVPVLIWFVSQYRPVMITRTMYWAVPMMPIGLAVVGYGLLPRPMLRGALIVLITLGVAHSAYQNHRDHKQDYLPLMATAYELGTDQTSYYGCTYAVSWTIEYLRRHDHAGMPSWTYLTDYEPFLSISQSPIYFDEAIEQMKDEDDIMLIVRNRYGIDEHLRPGLEQTHTFTLLSKTSEQWDHGALYRVQRREEPLAE